MSEIRSSGEEDSVDSAIAVLLQSGMSTDSLRLAATNGVVIENAGVLRVSFMMVAFIIWIQDGLILFFVVGNRMMGGVAVIQALIWLVLFTTLPREGRAFAANVAFKFNLLLSMPFALMPFFDGLGGVLQTETVDLVLGSLTILFSAAGVGRLSAVPLVGPPLANFIVLYSCPCSIFCRSCSWLRFYRPGRDHEPVGAAVELSLPGP